MSKHSCGNQVCPNRLIHDFKNEFHRPSDDRFPAQEIIAGASKVPSVIYYDKSGRVKAIGAEAMKDGVQLTAMESGWYKAEWYVFPKPRL